MALSPVRLRCSLGLASQPPVKLRQVTSEVAGHPQPPTAALVSDRPPESVKKGEMLKTNDRAVRVPLPNPYSPSRVPHLRSHLLGPPFQVPSSSPSLGPATSGHPCQILPSPHSRSPVSDLPLELPPSGITLRSPPLGPPSQVPPSGLPFRSTHLRLLLLRSPLRFPTPQVSPSGPPSQVSPLRSPPQVLPLSFLPQVSPSGPPSGASSDSPLRSSP